MRSSGECIWDDKMATVKLDDLKSKYAALSAIQNIVAANNCSFEVAVEQYKEVIEVSLKAFGNE